MEIDNRESIGVMVIADDEGSEVEKWVIVGEISKDGNALTEQTPSFTYL